ncbi:hypothetical protein [Ralstonia phage RP13]|nr:hypothetical protein [Ralstonia phage RP13]
MIKTSVVITHLRKLGDIYFKTDDINRATTFNNAATAILSRYPEHLPEDINQLRDIQGIGPSTINECKAAIETGTSPRLLELEKRAAEPSEDKVKQSMDMIKNLLKNKK